METRKINENFYLCKQDINKTVSVNTSQQTNHIFVVDVSGSMYYDLPLIRKQLKNKLPSLMKDGDTISIVWFSGDQQAGILMEEIEIKSLNTFTHINDAIDRWLKPIGLTAFNKPLQLTEKIINNIQPNRPNGVFSLIFLTDGYNNNCSFTDVKETLTKLTPKLASSLFVEYGFYADTQKLTEMAAIAGGEKISCDNFDDFDPVFENKISQNIVGGKKQLIDLDSSNILHDFVYTYKEDGSVIIYNVEYRDDTPSILVGNDVKSIYWFTDKTNDNLTTELLNNGLALYAGVYVLSDKILSDEVEVLLGHLGDVYFYEKFVNSFGKQKLNEFKNEVKLALTDSSKRFINGYNKSIVVDENAYCLMDLINDLTFMDNVLFYPSHSAFSYKRIGRKKLQVGSKLTESEKKELNDLKNLDELSEKVNELKKTKVDLKFVPFDKEKGYPIRDLVWNENRANLSVRVRYDGEVNLPENEYNLETITSFMYRTYTLVKDGIVNVNNLPLSYNFDVIELLEKNNVDYEVIFKDDDTDQNFNKTVILVDLKSLPIVNKGMVKSLTAKNLALLEWELLKTRANKKVVDYFKNKYFPKESKTFNALVGEDAANWLKEIGITDFNGFAPKTQYEEATDTYNSVNLQTKIKGYSTLPKVIDVVNKIQNNKLLKPTEELMEDVVTMILSSIEDDGDDSKVFSELIHYLSDIANHNRKFLLQQIVRIKFALILSKKWFKEFNSFDEDTINVNIEGNDLQFTFKLFEKEEKV